MDAPSTLAPFIDYHAPFEIGQGELLEPRLKEVPEDFRVEEIPAYKPSGEGDHLYLWVEKTGLGHMHLLSHVARTLQIRPDDIGAAGMKDARAVTRQYLSVPASAEPRVSLIDNAQVRVLSSGRHGNKLKTGHLKGNKFVVRVLGLTDEVTSRALIAAPVLAAQGVPNYFGRQRFGREDSTLTLGYELVLGKPEPKRLSKSMRRLALSAVQSALFNQALRDRSQNSRLHQVELGEVLSVVQSGGPFFCDDVAQCQQRFMAREVVPTGPLFGSKMRRAQGEPGDREARLLATAGIDENHLARQKKLMSGTRRPLLVYCEELEVQRLGDARGGLEARFFLPAGSYATVMLGELLAKRPAN